MVCNASGSVVQRTYFHPYGKSIGNCESTGQTVQPFKFNGAEQETMMGLTQFDLGNRSLDYIYCGFPTMDRFAEKFPWQSPYVHAANNPVNYVDVNGDSIWFSSQYDDNNQLTGVTMHVTGKVINVSNNNVDMDAATAHISEQLQSSFNGKVDGVAFTTDVQLSVAKTMDDVAASDHVFALADINKLGDNTVFGGVNMNGGKVAFIDADYFTGLYDRYIGSVGQKEAAHEFGHLAGLSHVTYQNLMKQNYGNNWFRFSSKIISSQLQQIYSGRANLNKGSNREYIPIFSPSAGGLIRKAMPNRGTIIQPLINY
jgi:RHS repeat-associated protein